MISGWIKALLQTACHRIPSASWLHCCCNTSTHHRFPQEQETQHHRQEASLLQKKQLFSLSQLCLVVLFSPRRQDPRAGFCPHPPSVAQKKKKKKRERWFAVGFSLSLYLDNGLTALQLQDSCEESTSITYRLTSSWSYLEGKSSLGSHPWK